MAETASDLPAMATGLVAIIDALGVRTLSAAEIAEFLAVRNSVAQTVQTLTPEIAAGGRRIPKGLHTFLLNDTIIVVLEADGKPTFADVGTMCGLLNKAFVPAFLRGVLFRGAVAIGDFYVDPKMMAVLGPAVVDAADWHEKTEWAGVHFTPKSSLRIDGFLAEPGTVKRQEWAVLRYPEVPIKQQKPAELFVLNWLQDCFGEFVRRHGRPPGTSRKDATRKYFVEVLASQTINYETHAKYANTLACIDWYLDTNPDHQ